MQKYKIGITIGDFNGVGLEVVLKSLSNKKVYDLFVPVIYGSSKVVSYHKNIVGVDDFTFNGIRMDGKIKEGKINVVNCWEENVNITLGKMSEASGKYALMALAQAVEDLNTGKIDALVTAPINKQAMPPNEFPYTGHTEYLEEKLAGGKSLMLMVNENLKVGLVTNHLPLKEVAEKISKELIASKLEVMNETLKIDFGLERPIIAVLALNPHAGDGGKIGDEEDKLIRPAIIEAKKKGMMVMGPFPADGFFGSGTYSKYDAILAMYHDQGLIPFKTLSFGEGVNYTAGLSGIRTSPDHGTAYEIAGQNEANPASFRRAMFLALDIVRQRKGYMDAHSDPVKSRAKLESEK